MPKLTGKIPTRCVQCRSVLLLWPSRYKQNKRHFCSYGCWYLFFKGKRCHLWKRGWWLSAQGYRMITIDGKPKAEHIYIMEKILGRKMKGRGKEVVHHLDGNKLNNKSNNLILMRMSDHQSMHATERWSASRSLERKTSLPYPRRDSSCVHSKRQNRQHKLPNR